MTKKKYLIFTVLVLLVTAVILGVWLYRHFMPTGNVQDYNTYASVHAYNARLITQQDILILHHISRSPGGDSVAEFYIYRLPTGANAEDYLGKRTSHIGSELEQLGTASCTFIDDNPSAIHNMTALYLR